MLNLGITIVIGTRFGAIATIDPTSGQTSPGALAPGEPPSPPSPIVRELLKLLGLTVTVVTPAASLGPFPIG